MGQGRLWPGVGRALCEANKTIDFRTSILNVVDEEDWLKTCCMVERGGWNIHQRALARYVLGATRKHSLSSDGG
ncbi:hypothetical protein CLM73_19445 [Achromobacter spanius]|uniref:Uncharacterized protein n=1 Tax=Achromobacter spanius TaxID=217203 RepID=A0A2S0IAW3_9BURK|nr:hypothetical protein CLM73_19445 [Achromobacter spanius]